MAVDYGRIVLEVEVLYPRWIYVEYDVCVIGDLVVDYIVRVERLPLNPNECQITSSAFKFPGGSANFLITASRLDLKVNVVDVVGDDENGKIILDILGSEGVDLRGVKVVKNARTTQVIILVDGEGNHAFIGVIGVRLKPEIVDSDLIVKSKYLYVSCYSMMSPSEIEATLNAINTAYENNVRIFFDPGPLHRTLPRNILREVISKSYITSLNSSEALGITGVKTVEDAAITLKNMGARIVVVKMGEYGALLLHNSRLERVESIEKIKAASTIGAGDCFNAGLICGLVKGLNLREAVLLANIVGAVKVKKWRQSDIMPSKDDVVRYLLKLRRYDILNKLGWINSRKHN